MTLPPGLLAAVSTPGGGKITLIIGAGCSLEPPTSLPLSRSCSIDCNDRLVADGLLSDGECPDPSDLSSLADTVYSKTGGQAVLVRQLLEHYPLKTATPNDGHLLAAALLGEGVVSSIVTLNFDLALTTAISWLGVWEQVGIIDGPEDLQNQKGRNLYYLHRNANAADADVWILRSQQLELEWRTHWESVVATKALAAPVVVFAGLGSPAAVLIESIVLIRSKAPDANKVYQVDPGPATSSAFYTALGIAASAYIQTSWVTFMEELSRRVVVEQLRNLEAAAHTMAAREIIPDEDLTDIVAMLLSSGLIVLGHMRAKWMLHDKPYLVDDASARELIGDLLLGVQMIARVSSAAFALTEDGVVEFRRDNRVVASFIIVSGKGTHGRIAVEALLSAGQRRYRTRSVSISGAIVAGLREQPPTPVTVPPDVVSGDLADSILTSGSGIDIHTVDSLRVNFAEIGRIVP